MIVPAALRTVFLRLLAVSAVVVVVVAVRVLVDSRAELARAEARRSAGDFESALAHYRRAARMYVPFSPYVTSALDAMESMAETEERGGQVERALFAWRQVRAGILAAQSFYVPHSDRLDRANRRIADLTAELPPPPIDAGKSREDLRLEHLDLLERARGPSVFFSWLAVAGWIGWITSAFGFLRHGIDGEDRIRRPAATRWATAFGVGFALFTLGLAFA